MSRDENGSPVCSRDSVHNLLGCQLGIDLMDRCRSLDSRSVRMFYTIVGTFFPSLSY